MRAHRFHHVTLINHDLSRALAPSPGQGNVSLVLLVDPHASGMMPVAIGTQGSCSVAWWHLWGGWLCSHSQSLQTAG